MSNATPKIFCIMGPTAVGKTQVAIDLLQQFPFEIISVDSAMIYRGLDIGTAKPPAEVLHYAPHRLINIRDANEIYSAAQFVTDALAEIKAVLALNKIPLLVGGTMLYFSALINGLSSLPPADATVRAKLLAKAESSGWQSLHDRLADIDPSAAQRIHVHDKQRLQRALEVFELTGQNLSAWQGQQESQITDYQFVNMAMMPTDRAALHNRIAQRFTTMLDEGFIAEVQALKNRGDLLPELPALKAVGYRQAWDYLSGQSTVEEMVDQAIAATRQLAKRQMTWLRNWNVPVENFDSDAADLTASISTYVAKNLPAK